MILLELIEQLIWDFCQLIADMFSDLFGGSRDKRA
jgi:hypothetical protein